MYSTWDEMTDVFRSLLQWNEDDTFDFIIGEIKNSINYFKCSCESDFRLSSLKYFNILGGIWRKFCAEFSADLMTKVCIGLHHIKVESEGLYVGYFMHRF